MSQDHTICITTSNRWEHSRIQEFLPKYWKDFVRFYVPELQVKKYKNILKGWTIVPVPKEFKYVAVQKQFVVDNRPSRFLHFWDDDINFSWRDQNMKLHKCDDAKMDEMLELSKHYLENGYGIVGISPRGGNGFKEKDFEENTRCVTAWALDTEVFDETEAECSPQGNIPAAMYDFHLNLHFLEHGYKNLSINTFCYNPLIASNGKGGCSVWRTPEVMDRTTKWMEANHPAFKRTRRVSKGWDGFTEVPGGSVRWDGKIEWKKAYRPKIKKDEGISRFL